MISGFTQHRGDATGSQKLWLRLKQFTSPRTAVEYFPWNCDWREIAEWIWRCGPDDRPPAVYVYAYSWGGGWGFPLLARELKKRGVEIVEAVLCDPVYRPRLRCLAWLALLPFTSIAVPSNVRRVRWFRQTMSLAPRGHALLADDPSKTVIEPAREILATHTYADDSPSWQTACCTVAAEARAAAPYIAGAPYSIPLPTRPRPIDGGRSA